MARLARAAGSSGISARARAEGGGRVPPISLPGEVGAAGEGFLVDGFAAGMETALLRSRVSRAGPFGRAAGSPLIEDHGVRSIDDMAAISSPRWAGGCA